MGREPEELTWWVKIEKPGVMDLIDPKDVTQRLDQFMQEATEGEGASKGSPPPDQVF
jgi:hypothetical protein